MWSKQVPHYCKLTTLFNKKRKEKKKLNEDILSLMAELYNVDYSQEMFWFEPNQLQNSPAPNCANHFWYCTFPINCTSFSSSCIWIRFILFLISLISWKKLLIFFHQSRQKCQFFSLKIKNKRCTLIEHCNEIRIISFSPTSAAKKLIKN